MQLLHTLTEEAQHETQLEREEEKEHVKQPFTANQDFKLKTIEMTAC